MAVPQATVDHYQTMQRLQVLAVAAGRRAWSRVDDRYLSESWRQAIPFLAPVVSAVQLRAATAGASYGAATLAEQGTWVAPEAFVNPAAFAGVASDGRTLEGLLYSPITTSKGMIAGGMSAAQALSQGRGWLDTIMRTTVADAGRGAASVDTASRKNVGYVRMLNPPSCSRCTILAGRVYAWNAGFRRHPRCDCVHVQTTTGSVQGAIDEGLIADPYEYFGSLSKAEQDRVFGAKNAEAIRDGADVSRVVNANRGRAGMTTTEGTTRRGFASDLRGQRLTPDGIYKQAASREEALQLLERHGYILPGGQVPTGAIVGQREGFGALGRGGTRVGARGTVLEARATGVRTGSRYTMTEAERRLFDSEQRYAAALQGRNPYSHSGAGLTPELSARAETDYRRWLTSGGQVFTS